MGNRPGPPGSQEDLKRKRLKSEGYGLTKPLVKPEATDEDAQNNRRVEFRLLEGGGAAVQDAPAR